MREEQYDWLKMIAASVGSVTMSAEEFNDISQAIEKSIAKKPVEYKLGGVAPFMFGTGKCPSCDESCNSDMMYCDKCGQKLRWFND